MGGSRRQIELLDRASASSIPLSVALELTRRCTFACRHCYLRHHHDRHSLPTSRWLELLDELASLGTLYLTLTGGEPLLRGDWARIGERARELGFVVTLLTNGALVDRRTAVRLYELDAVVEVSYYADDPRVFDAITRRRGSHDAVRRGIERLVAEGVAPVLKTPLMTLNRGEVGAIRAFAARLGLRLELYPLIAGRAGAGPSSVRLGRSELVEHFRAEAEGGELTRIDRRVVPPDAPMCGAGTRGAVVTSGGEVLACALLPRSAGSVATRSFADVWHGSRWFEELRQTRWGELDTCSDCGSSAACGRCPAIAAAEEGDLRGPSRAACAIADAVADALG